MQARKLCLKAWSFGFGVITVALGLGTTRSLWSGVVTNSGALANARGFWCHHLRSGPVPRRVTNSAASSPAAKYNNNNHGRSH
ncbi:hypothetical protein NEOLEDRAFT_1139750 [Neolentinus lepideus HHB14362 ss-1]|uniref:Uncharacterized protein n=1 Tax=Neolentinus lepideus HHB14362 ss-1 TaxID=1314782 RepID=A0A165PJQ1_9AGAM|nr:hypothetical protein NEOLEDRAFT_1139750 [Neolentinus lepideus HHB14362 ss-1]